jgi:hypothetical protein
MSVSSSEMRTPEDLVEIGFSRSRVVLMNEAHNGWLRCVRTREIGRRVLPVAHAAGVRHLAMEALADRGLVEEANRSRFLPEVRGQSYLAQPEMRTFIQTALDLGWTLIGYEADMSLAPAEWDPLSDEFTSWREKQQALNLVRALESLPSASRILVWCGSGHLYKSHLPWSGSWEPMGWHFRDLSGIDPFAIDQVVTVDFGEPVLEKHAVSEERYATDLRILGGTAGFLAKEAPQPWASDDVDAVIISLENEMELSPARSAVLCNRGRPRLSALDFR